MSNERLEDRMMELGEYANALRQKIICSDLVYTVALFSSHTQSKYQDLKQSFKKYESKFDSILEKQLEKIKLPAYLKAEIGAGLVGLIATAPLYEICDLLNVPNSVEALSITATHCGVFWYFNKKIYLLSKEKEYELDKKEEKHDKKYLNWALGATTAFSLAFQGWNYYIGCNGQTLPYLSKLVEIPGVLRPAATFTITSIPGAAIRHGLTFGFGLWGKKTRDKIINFALTHPLYI